MAPVITPVTGPARTPDTSTEVDQQKVDMALRTIRADVPMNQSQLANALRNPNLNQAERNEIVKTLAGEDGQQLRFFGNDAARSIHDEGGTSLSDDQTVIADALQQAYDDGAIDQKDLLRIADVNEAGNGAQRLMAILQQGTTTTEANGVAEKLADALWARNEGSDRAAASIFYTSDPTMMSRNLNTADKRAEAFEALVDFNDGNPYEHIPEGYQRTVWQNAALTAEGRLFNAHSQELMDRYTGQDGTTVATEPLAKFMSQTLFNPDAQGIVLNRTQDLVPTIRTAMGNAAQTYLDRATDAPNGSLEQSRAMQQFGRLAASVTGGAAKALDAYDDAIMANEESKKQFSDMVGGVIGMTPLGTALDKIPAGGGDQLVEALSGKIYDAMVEHPDRPDAALSGVLYDQYAGQAEQASDQTGENLSTYFESGYSAEVLNLQQNLNVNLGGHQS